MAKKKTSIKTKKQLNMAPFLFIAAVIVFIGGYVLLSSSGPKEDYNRLTTCMTENGVKMYGSITCSVCNRVRTYLGHAFENIDEIECNPRTPGNQAELCLEKKIEKTPTWIIEKNGEDIKREEGFMTAEQLAEFSGCSLGE
jgi:hypothetical protein